MPDFVNPNPTFTVDEAAARRVLLLQAFESAPDGESAAAGAASARASLWTTEDRAWATRVALQSVPADAGVGPFVAERAAQALQRLAPRDDGVRRLLARPGWNAWWPLVAVSVAFAGGLLVDQIGASQEINLLAPPVWTLVLWNLVVYALLALQALRGAGQGSSGPWRRWLLARLTRRRRRAGSTSPRAAFAVLWARHGGPLMAARLALLLHAAAAALALGVIAGMYLRGLVLAYGAGWGSTFLNDSQVQQVLGWLLAPASVVAGLALPPLAESGASAAPWIHLYAVTLALAVVLPRTLLATAAGLRAWRRARHIALPLADPYFQRLLRPRAGPALVAVRPYAKAPAAGTALGLRTLLAAVLGDGVQLHLDPPCPVGDEDSAAPPPGSTLLVALFDFSAIPEVEAQGRFMQALHHAAPALPLLMLVDETAFRRRFASMPGRIAERRAAWQGFAKSSGAALVCADLEHPDAAAETALQDALSA